MTKKYHLKARLSLTKNSKTPCEQLSCHILYGGFRRILDSVLRITFLTIDSQ